MPAEKGIVSPLSRAARMLALPSVAIVLMVVGGRVKAAGVGVGVMSEVVQQYLFRCHLVLVDAAGGSPDFTNILR